MEVPGGFEPSVIELQSIALPTWLRNHALNYLSTKLFIFQDIYELTSIHLTIKNIIDTFYFLVNKFSILNSRKNLLKSEVKGGNIY